MMPSTEKRWPSPLLQPDPHTGCMVHSVAYIARVFGRTQTTPEEVEAWADSQRMHWGSFVGAHCPRVRVQRYWDDWDTDATHELHKRYWMGPQNRLWVQGHLQAGHVALAHVHRVMRMSHVVALLGFDTADVLLMDPLYGFRKEPWPWFLGLGAGSQINHHIDAWYSNEQCNQEGA